MRTIRTKPRKNTISKYMNCLIAYEQQSGSISNVTEITRQYNASNYIATFLRKNRILYNQNGYYYWNEAYKPNIEMVDAILNEASTLNKKYGVQKKSKSTPTLFDQKKQYKRKHKFDSEKIKHQPKFNELNTEQVGIIRKFLKWLW